MNPASHPAADPIDPVLVRRARIAKWTDIGKRVGYLLYAIAVVVYFLGLFVEYTPLMTTTIIGCLVIGGVILAPAIVFGYGVKAAEREEREQAAANAASAER